MVFRNLLKKVIGDPNEREIKRFREVVEDINALESDMKGLSDAELAGKTAAFKAQLAGGEELDDVMVEAFALVREASRRVTGLRHFDVQLIGGIVLHHGKISEMKTGEGKTLVATLPLYLNALAGKGVHLVTPNDYLSKFGLQQMGPIYHLLGLSASVIQNAAADQSRGSFIYDPTFQSDDERYQNLRPCTRREAYATDVTYGTNNEFGFDYLRDNMVRTESEKVQRGHFYAIVDEVDNILIDEARTPLIISGMADRPSDHYGVFAKLVKNLKVSSKTEAELTREDQPDGDFVRDLKGRSVYLTETGIDKIERNLKQMGLLQGDTLYSPENSDMVPYLDNSLRATFAYDRDKDYMVEKGQIIIVDEFTGRAMYGRRFSEGLHQAIEAKEGVEVQRENMTLATITFQNYFRLYEKLGGMTGTAMTEADEFLEIYKLDVNAIPTHRTVTRKDQEDVVYMTEKAKWNAIVSEIKIRNANQQPILIGTVAIETSERLAKLLEREHLPHSVLNAKQHEREAIIIAQAGRPGAVTIATNMAGRGVDILLGGNPDGLAREHLRKNNIEITDATPEQWQAALEAAKAECARDREVVINAGGLFVIGTERHEARRIDNQLRGRAGRQGDPGESLFYLSLEDDLMRKFGGDRVKGLMQGLKMPEDEPITHGIITRSIQQAQSRVEGYNFDIRKRVLEYDDVVNKQRTVIYQQRGEILASENLRPQIERMISEIIDDTVNQFYPDSADDEIDAEELYRALLAIYPVPQDITPDVLANQTDDEMKQALIVAALNAYDKKEAVFGRNPVTDQPLMREIERLVMLDVVDNHWRRHLTDLDQLREGIGLMAIAQRDPLVEYKRSSFQMWEVMQKEIRQKVVELIYRVEVQQQQPAANGPRNNNNSSSGGNGGSGGTSAEIQQALAAPKIKGMAGQVRNVKATQASVESVTGGSGPAPVASREAPAEPVKADMWSKVGPNDLCPCGSGKKFKKCHYPILRDQKTTVTR